jgi:hypothetical protein
MGRSYGVGYTRGNEGAAVEQSNIEFFITKIN